MSFCIKCGNELHLKHLDNEGMIPFCDKCNEYRFEQFNVAVSMVVLNKEMNKYFADAWLNISNPDQRIWQVHMNMASDYRRVQPDAVSYIMYIDAGTGEVLDVMKY